MLGYQYRYPLDVCTFIIGEFHGNTYIPLDRLWIFFIAWPPGINLGCLSMSLATGIWKKLYPHTTLVYKLSSSSSLWLFELSKLKMIENFDILIDLVKWKHLNPEFCMNFKVCVRQIKQHCYNCPFSFMRSDWRCTVILCKAEGKPKFIHCRAS